VTEHASQFPVGAVEIEVVEDRGAADQVEALIFELQVLGVHDIELD
jgi:hypothetical protein